MTCIHSSEVKEVWLRTYWEMNSVSERLIVCFFSLSINFSKYFANVDSSVERKSRQQNFDTPLRNLHNEKDISIGFEKSRALLILELENNLRDGSSWLLDSIDELSVDIVSYNQLGGSGYISTPEFIDRKKKIINIKNDDDKCFLWCVLTHSNTTNSHPARVSHYRPYFDTLVPDLRYPVTLDQIPKFENANKLSIIVLGYRTIMTFILYMHPLRCPPKT